MQYTFSIKMPIRILDDSAVCIYQQPSAGDMSKISSLGGMMQMMEPTENGVDRKRSAIISLAVHCVGKVNTGFLTCKKEGLFFGDFQMRKKIGIHSI